MPLNIEEEEDDEVDDEEFSLALQPEPDIPQLLQTLGGEVFFSPLGASDEEDEEMDVMREHTSSALASKHLALESDPYEAEEACLGHQLQCKRGDGKGGGQHKRKMPVQDVTVLISTHEYREWQQECVDLVSEVR